VLVDEVPGRVSAVGGGPTPVVPLTTGR
jgi:hypothetical protein